MAAPTKPIPEVIDEKTVRLAISINADAIQEEYINLPATRHKFSRRHIAAAKAHRLAELEDEIEEQKIRSDLGRLASEATPPKKLTVADLEQIVILDPRYRQSKERVILAREAMDEAAAVVASISDKKEMLVSLGADLRTEKEADPGIRTRR
jgi:hypothetical protein